MSEDEDDEVYHPVVDTSLVPQITRSEAGAIIVELSENVTSRVVIFEEGGVGGLIGSIFNNLKCMCEPYINYASKDSVTETLLMSAIPEINKIGTAHNALVVNGRFGEVENFHKDNSEWREEYKRMALTCLIELNEHIDFGDVNNDWYSPDFVKKLMPKSKTVGDFDSEYDNIRSTVVNAIETAEDSTLVLTISGLVAVGGEKDNAMDTLNFYNEDDETSIRNGNGAKCEVRGDIKNSRHAPMLYDILSSPRCIGKYFAGLTDPEIMGAFEHSIAKFIAPTTISGSTVYLRKSDITVITRRSQKIVTYSKYIKEQLCRLNVVSIYILGLTLLSAVLKGVAVIREAFKVDVLYVTLCYLRQKEIVRIYLHNTDSLDNFEILTKAVNYCSVPYICTVLHTLDIQTIDALYRELKIDDFSGSQGFFGNVYDYLSGLTSNCLSYTSTDILFPDQAVVFCNGLTDEVPQVGMYAIILKKISEEFSMRDINNHSIEGYYYKYQLGQKLKDKVDTAYLVETKNRNATSNNKKYIISNGLLTGTGDSSNYDIFKIYTLIRAIPTQPGIEEAIASSRELKNLKDELRLIMIKTISLQNESKQLELLKNKVIYSNNEIKSIAENVFNEAVKIIGEKENMVSEMRENVVRYLNEKAVVEQQIIQIQQELEAGYAEVRKRESAVNELVVKVNENERKVKDREEEIQKNINVWKEEMLKLQKINERIEDEKNKVSGEKIMLEGMKRDTEEKLQKAEAAKIILQDELKKIENDLYDTEGERAMGVLHLNEFRNKVIQKDEAINILTAKLGLANKEIERINSLYKEAIRKLNLKHAEELNKLRTGLKGCEDGYKNNNEELQEAVYKFKQVFMTMENVYLNVVDDYQKQKSEMLNKLDNQKNMSKVKYNEKAVLFMTDYRKKVDTLVEKLENELVKIRNMVNEINNINEDEKFTKLKVELDEVDKAVAVDAEDLKAVELILEHSYNSETKMNIIDSHENDIENDYTEEENIESRKAAVRREYTKLDKMLEEIISNYEGDKISDDKSVEIEEIRKNMRELEIESDRLNKIKEQRRTRHEMDVVMTEEYESLLKEKKEKDELILDIEDKRFKAELEIRELTKEITKKDREIEDLKECIKPVGKDENIEEEKFTREEKDRMLHYINNLSEVITEKNGKINELAEELKEKVKQSEGYTKLTDIVKLLPKDKPFHVNDEILQKTVKDLPVYKDPDTYEKWVKNVNEYGDDQFKILIKYKNQKVDFVEEIKTNRRSTKRVAKRKVVHYERDRGSKRVK